MESIIASDIKSFFFSNGLIFDDQFGFTPSYSTLDMLLLLSQQWMEFLNARHEIRAFSLDISHAFDMVWHPALLTKLFLWYPRTSPLMARRLPLLSEPTFCFFFTHKQKDPTVRVYLETPNNPFETPSGSSP